MFWNYKIKDSLAFFEAHSAKHPLFALYSAEMMACWATLEESQDKANETFKRLDAAQALVKGYMQTVGKTLHEMGHPLGTFYQSSSGSMLSGFMRSRRSSKTTVKSPEEVALLEDNYLWLRVVAAMIPLWRCVVQFRLIMAMKGAYNFREAWKALNTADRAFNVVAEGRPNGRDDLDPALRCALDTPFGAYHYALTLVPAQFKWIAELIGLSGDLKRGLAELSAAASTPGPGTPFALFCKIWMEIFFYENIERAETFCAQALERWPNSAVFRYMEGYNLRKTGRLEEATKNYQRVYDDGAETRQIQLMAIYELGNTEYLKLNWEAAIPHLEEFLAEHDTPTFRANASYQLGLCYDNTGNREKALEWWAKTPEWTRKGFTYDAFAKRKALEYTETVMTQMQRDIVSAFIQYEAGMYRKGLELLTEKVIEPLGLQDHTTDTVAAFNGDVELAAQYLYIRGAHCSEIEEHHDLAVYFLQGVVDLGEQIVSEKYLVPFSLCELGKIYCIRGHWALAAEALSTAKAQSNGVDLDKPLGRRIDMLDRSYDPKVKMMEEATTQ